MIVTKSQALVGKDTNRKKAMFLPITLLWVVLLTALATDASDIVMKGLQQRAYLIAVIMVVITAVIYVIYLPGSLIMRLIRNSPQIALYCLAMISTQTILVLNGEIGNSDIIQVLGYAIVAFIAYIIFPLALVKLGILRQWWTALAVIGVFSSVLGLLSLLGVENFLGLTVRRSHVSILPSLGISSTDSFFRQRLAFGAQAFLGFVGASRFFSKGEMKLKVFVSLLICLIGLFLSLARGVWVGLFVGTSVWYLVKFRRLTQKFALIIAASVFTIFIFLLIEFSPLIAQITNAHRGASGRGGLWSAGIIAISEEPILGYGLSQAGKTVFEFGEGLVPDYILANLAVTAGYHNFLIDTAVSMGLPTLTALVLLIVMSIRRLWRTSFDFVLKRTISLGVIGMLVASFFVTYNLGGIRSTSFAFGVLLGLANASPLVFEQKNMVGKDEPQRDSKKELFNFASGEKKKANAEWNIVLAVALFSFSLGILIPLLMYF